MRNELAQLYRQVGRESEAAAIEEHLHSLLKSSDARPIASLNSSASSEPMSSSSERQRD